LKGGWTFAFKSYHELNITANLDSPGINALESLVDPASYLDRYRNINFLVLNCAGDEFFLPGIENFLIFSNYLSIISKFKTMNR
jgi:PhoPQ-activated pathogenicity-related protein